MLDPDQVMSAMKGCDVVVNCARDKGVKNKDVVDFYVKSTSNLLQYAELNEVKKFIHLSTAAVHDLGRDYSISETSRLVRTSDAYIRGKLESEKLVLAYQHRLPIVVLRPTMIYGPYSANWVTEFIDRLQNQRPLTLRDDSLANLIYIDDVVRAILLAIESDQANGQVFIINNDRENISWKDYIMNISTGLGFLPRSTPESSLLIQRIDNVFALLRDSLMVTRELLTSTEALSILARIPIVLKFGQILVRGVSRREKIQEKLKAPTHSRSDSYLNVLYKYETIDKALHKILTSRSSFSSEHARRRLGFEPHCPFSEGMPKTLDWAKWWVDVDG